MLTRNSRICVGQGREELHPLANSTILRNIFEYLDFKTLKSVRETCSFWNEDSYGLLQNKSKVTISWYDETDETKIPTLPTFMKYVQSVTSKSKQVFFRNYVLVGWAFHSKESEMTQFFLNCGQHIRDLFLRGNCNGFYEESTVRDVFYNWTPNMESFHIDDNVKFRDYPNYKPRRTDTGEECGCEEAYTNLDFSPMSKFEVKEDIQPNYNFQNLHIDQCFVTPIFPLSWKELFLAFPNLKTISVNPLFLGDEFNDRDICKGLLTALVEFQEENPKKLQNLKQLDVLTQTRSKGFIEETHFEYAMKLNFKLETFHINEARKLSSYSLIKYIDKLSSSLKSLKIDSDHIPVNLFPPTGQIISFPNLKNLCIKLNTMNSDNMDFLQNTPKLETLRIWHVEECKTTEPGVELLFNTITLEPLTTLRHFEVSFDFLTEDCVRKIGEWFPNLSHFAAVVNDRLLWAVYKFLNNSVETLEVTGNGITDAGITGIRKRRIHGPSIGQMKKLRRLSIDTEFLPISGMVRLTDDAIHNGFILLAELTYLKISVGEDSITEQAYRELCDLRNIITLDTPRFCRGHWMKKSGWYKGRTFMKTQV